MTGMREKTRTKYVVFVAFVKRKLKKIFQAQKCSPGLFPELDFLLRFKENLNMFPPSY